MKSRATIIQKLFDDAVAYRCIAVEVGKQCDYAMADKFLNYFTAIMVELDFIDPSTNWNTKVFQEVWERMGRG